LQKKVSSRGKTSPGGACDIFSIFFSAIILRYYFRRVIFCHVIFSTREFLKLKCAYPSAPSFRWVGEVLPGFPH
jgi:hypothetical protein